MDPDTARRYGLACDLVLSSRETVVLTGAGISTRSGIPDFRTPDTGLWTSIDPFAVASIWGFKAQPERFYRWIQPLVRKMVAAKPNPAHEGLVLLEDLGLVSTVITQNVDELHQRAGSKRVLQVHGNTAGATCVACGYTEKRDLFWERVLARDEVPRCPRCDQLLKPDLVLFGEELPAAPLMAAQQAALNCDLMIVAGTSLEVMPVADLPWLAKRQGAQVLVFNQGCTVLDEKADLVIQEDLTVSLPHLAELCARQKARP